MIFMETIEHDGVYFKCDGVAHSEHGVDLTHVTTNGNLVDLVGNELTHLVFGKENILPFLSMPFREKLENWIYDRLGLESSDEREDAYQDGTSSIRHAIANGY